MAEARKLSAADLREIVTDPSELAKGTRFFDDGGLSHLARFQAKLFADAAGSGSSPYKVQIVFEEKGVRGRCSCMAARSRPFCKHAAALLVAWSRASDMFAEAAEAPEGMGGAPKKKAVKQGKVEAKEHMARGVGQVMTLVRELAVAGVASLAADRAPQVHALGDGLREAKLRRVSVRTLELSLLLGKAAARSDAFDEGEYTELLADLLLTARKLEKHIAGEPLAEEHVENLIGKTWTKKDRKPVAGLDLLEIAYGATVTPDDFVIRESRFVDLKTGEHYTEKQILPGFLARRTPPKKSWSGQVLTGATGSLYPSYAPRRIDLDVPTPEAADGAQLARLIDVATPTVAGALASLQERRKDVFAPDAMPTTLRVARVLAEGKRLQLVDADGAALFLADDEDIEQTMVFGLRDRALVVMLGDVALDGALPTFFPLAMIARERERLVLVPFGARDAATRIESKKVRRAALERSAARRTRWVDVARSVGASPAAIALGELRDEMASALALGLGSVTPRFTDPLVSRLTDLGLTKQAELLRSIGTRQDPAEKLDDFIKLHQVLGIALTRLAGATHVEGGSLAAVPTYESVFVREPGETLVPREVARRVGAGTMNRWEASLHYARYYEALSPEALAADVYPTWADGSATPFVARAFQRAPALAVTCARRVLFEDTEPARVFNALKGGIVVPARVAKITAVRVLTAVGTPEAKAVLQQCVAERATDNWRATLAQRALWTLAGQEVPEVLRTNVENLTRLVWDGSARDDRIHALETLAKLGAVEAIPAMRASFLGDVTAGVREAAAFALARVGDVDSVDMFVRLLRNRNEDAAAAKIGAYALGMIGDVRGMDELLRAYAEGWQPGIVAEAMRELGEAALDPLLSLLESRPELAERKAALNVLVAVPEDALSAMLVTRLESLAESPDFVARASLYMTIAAGKPSVAQKVAKRIAELRPVMLDKKKSSTEEKALARKCAKHLD